MEPDIEFYVRAEGDVHELEARLSDETHVRVALASAAPGRAGGDGLLVSVLTHSGDAATLTAVLLTIRSILVSWSNSAPNVLRELTIYKTSGKLTDRDVVDGLQSLTGNSESSEPNTPLIDEDSPPNVSPENDEDASG